MCALHGRDVSRRLCETCSLVAPPRVYALHPRERQTGSEESLQHMCQKNKNTSAFFRSDDLGCSQIIVEREKRTNTGHPIRQKQLLLLPLLLLFFLFPQPELASVAGLRQLTLVRYRQVVLFVGQINTKAAPEHRSQNDPRYCGCEIMGRKPNTIQAKKLVIME